MAPNGLQCLTRPRSMRVQRSSSCTVMKLECQLKPLPLTYQRVLIWLKLTTTGEQSVGGLEYSPATCDCSRPYMTNMRRNKPGVSETRVMVYICQWKHCKITQPFYGQYHILELHPNESLAHHIWVNIEWITPCPRDLPNTTWLRKNLVPVVSLLPN